jgi:bifunctional polynucleotide phosphatase/kinase
VSLEAHERIVATWEHSVVIDNTNPSASVRAEYIAIAQDQEIPVRCFVFKTPLELAQHMNSYRQNVFGVKHVPGVGYNMYVS